MIFFDDRFSVVVEEFDLAPKDAANRERTICHHLPKSCYITWGMVIFNRKTYFKPTRRQQCMWLLLIFMMSEMFRIICSPVQAQSINMVHCSMAMPNYQSVLGQTHRTYMKIFEMIHIYRMIWQPCDACSFSDQAVGFGMLAASWFCQRQRIMW